MVQQRERKLVWEWMMKFHLTALKWRNVRVGAIPEGKYPELYGTLRKYADAVYFENEIVHIIEAKVIPKANVIYDLIDYKNRFEDTPDFIQYKGKPIKMIYLAAVHDKYIKAECEKAGIEFIVYTPEWIKIYLREKGYKI